MYQGTTDTVIPPIPPERGHPSPLKLQYQVRMLSSTGSLSPEDAKNLILSTIGESRVTIFSKTYCPFCDKTKKLFRTLGEDAKILELDRRPDGSIIQEELARMTGQRSVPNVFVRGQHTGGNDDCQALARSGKLQEMLKG
jgi:glutaredoxin 3